MSYRTKTQKKNALEAIKAKAFKLVGSGVISINEYGKIGQVCNSALRKL